jgi:DNA-binding transcriptional regulator PaaX
MSDQRPSLPRSTPERLVLLAVVARALEARPGGVDVFDIINALGQLGHSDLLGGPRERHTSALVKAGLLSKTRSGRQVLYRLTPAGWRALD